MTTMTMLLPKLMMVVVVKVMMMLRTMTDDHHLKNQNHTYETGSYYRKLVHINSCFSSQSWLPPCIFPCMYCVYIYIYIYTLSIYDIIVRVWLETDDTHLVIMLYMVRKLALVRVKYATSVTLNIVY